MLKIAYEIRESGAPTVRYVRNGFRDAKILHGIWDIKSHFFTNSKKMVYSNSTSKNNSRKIKLNSKYKKDEKQTD